MLFWFQSSSLWCRWAPYMRRYCDVIVSSTIKTIKIRVFPVCSHTHDSTQTANSNSMYPPAISGVISFHLLA